LPLVVPGLVGSLCLGLFSSPPCSGSCLPWCDNSRVFAWLRIRRSHSVRRSRWRSGRLGYTREPLPDGHYLCNVATMTSARITVYSWLALLLLFAGCAVSEPSYLANGQKVVRIKCNVALDGMTSCFKEAGDICGPRGYVIYDWNGQAWPKPYPGPDVLEYDP